MERELRTSLARRVRDIRAARGMTQEEVAGATGLSVAAVSAVERGTKLPTLATLVSLADGFGLPVAALLERIDERLTERQAAEAKLRIGLRKLSDRDVARLLDLVGRLRGLDDRKARVAVKVWESVNGLPRQDAWLFLELAQKLRKAADARRKPPASARRRSSR
jgi:transcriptional regulator with XRE-family HTH domain